MLFQKYCKVVVASAFLIQKMIEFTSFTKIFQNTAVTYKQYFTYYSNYEIT